MTGPTLITGGAGFIGSHLARRLLAAGQSVRIIDDLSTGRLENIRPLLDQGLNFIEGSVTDPTAMVRAMADVTAVYHLAAAVGVQLVVERPIHTIRTTVGGTEAVLEQAAAAGVPVLITSSSEVYGKGSRVPFAESDDIVMGPTEHSRWCYAYAKGIDEFLGLAYHRERQLPVRIVRLFNTVGPGQVGQYGMVLPRFVEAALAGRPLRVFGDGRQTRCFCHVSDVTGAMVKLMASDRAAGQVFNLGSDEEVSIDELARRVIRLTNSASGVEYVDYAEAYGQPFDDLPRRVPDLRRIRTAIDFRPEHDLDAIVRSVVASFEA
ncbi:MAG: NAD-dependent epimerase/dehydratase family protein [Phycisphaerae bacterium]